jgi:hypothetical protein
MKKFIIFNKKRSLLVFLMKDSIKIKNDYGF